MAEKLAQRVAALERQMARLCREQETDRHSGRRWLDDLYGAFEGDPVFESAMKLGRKYRRSLAPRSKKTKSA